MRAMTNEVTHVRATDFLCWRPANVPILPVSAPTSKIDCSIPLWRQATAVQQTVLFWRIVCHLTALNVE